MYSPKYKRFRRLIIERRRQKGVTQAQLAQKLGRPQSFVSKYENGERRIDLIEFMEIAAALGIDPVKFVRDFQETVAEDGV